jgi:hypothetical protein
MARYYVRSPVSGAWFRSMGNGSSLDKAEAYAYAAGDPHLASMVAAARRFGAKLHLTQVRGPVVCPECLGEGDSPHRPYFECDYCGGTGQVNA